MLNLYLAFKVITRKWLKLFLNKIFTTFLFLVDVEHNHSTIIIHILGGASTHGLGHCPKS